MNVSKEQIQRGLVKYLENDVVKVIGDKPVMMATAVITSMIKNDDSMIGRAVSNPIVSVLLKHNADGSYDLDGLFNAITSTISEYGNFEVKFPLLGKPFIFNKNDFDKLKSYIEER